MTAFHAIAIPHDDILLRCLMDMYAGRVCVQDEVEKIATQGRLCG